MKILYITASLPYGTTEVFAVPELRELVRRGHEVRLAPMSRYAATPPSDAQPFVPWTIYTPLTSASSLGSGVAEIGKNPNRTFRTLHRTLKGQPQNIVTKNLSVFPRALWLARFARRWGAEHIHAYWASVPATAAMVASEVSGIPWSFTAHRWDIVQPNAFAAKLESARFARFISQDGLELAKPQAGDALREKGTIIRMGVPFDGQTATPTPLPEGVHLRVVCAATLIPRKGQRFLLEATATLKRQGLRVMLSLAGEGQTRPALEAHAEALGVRDQVTLLGNVDHAELLRRYGAGEFDAFVLPSLHEGISVALIEAMSYGLPVIATDVGGTRELLAGDAGVLIPAESSARVAEALELFIRQPERRLSIAQTGRARVLDMHDVKRVVDALEVRFGAQNAVQETVVI